MVGEFVCAKFGWLQLPDGKKSAQIIMKPGKNWDGCMTAGDIRSPQPLYFLECHACTGVFKGMAVILKEGGLTEEAKLHADSQGFQCTPPAINCCCHRVLHNQPDFAHLTTILENTCTACGFHIIAALDYISLATMWQCVYSTWFVILVTLTLWISFSNCPQKFMHAYMKGLNGQQAAL